VAVTITLDVTGLLPPHAEIRGISMIAIAGTIKNRTPRRRLQITRQSDSSANLSGDKIRRPRKTAVCVPSSIVIVVVSGNIQGLTLEGLKLHDAPDGRPEHENVIAELKPFCGLRVRVTMPDSPEWILIYEGEAERAKVGGTMMIV